MYLTSKFWSIRRTLVFETKFTQNKLNGGVLGQTQPENNLF